MNTIGYDTILANISKVDVNEAGQQAAIVAAFESVRPSFVWDEQRRQFVAQ